MNGLASTLKFGEHIAECNGVIMDQMAALTHLRSLIKAAQGSDDVEALQGALREMLIFIEKSLGRKG
jgi:hypothetical protein